MTLPPPARPAAATASVSMTALESIRITMRTAVRRNMVPLMRHLRDARCPTTRSASADETLEYQPSHASGKRLLELVIACCGLRLSPRHIRRSSRISVYPRRECRNIPRCLMTNPRERCVRWSRRERARLCGGVNRRIVECRVGEAILVGAEPRLGKPDRRDDGEISLIHWRPRKV